MAWLAKQSICDAIPAVRTVKYIQAQPGHTQRVPITCDRTSVSKRVLGIDVGRILVSKPITWNVCAGWADIDAAEGCCHNTGTAAASATGRTCSRRGLVAEDNAIDIDAVCSVDVSSSHPQGPALDVARHVGQDGSRWALQQQQQQQHNTQILSGDQLSLQTLDSKVRLSKLIALSFPHLQHAAGTGSMTWCSTPCNRLHAVRHLLLPTCAVAQRSLLLVSIESQRAPA